MILSFKTTPGVDFGYPCYLPQFRFDYPIMQRSDFLKGTTRICRADSVVKNLAKTEVDLVADEFIDESRREVRELLVKLYKRNPDQLAIIPGMTVKGRIAQLRTAQGELDFPELDGLQGIDAMNLTFDPNFTGDRVFALIVGLGGMLRQAYSYKSEMFIHDQLNGAALLTSARNVEILVWKLKNTRKPNGTSTNPSTPTMYAWARC